MTTRGTWFVAGAAALLSTVFHADAAAANLKATNLKQEDIYMVEANFSEAYDVKPVYKFFLQNLDYMPPAQQSKYPVEGKYCDDIKKHLPSECTTHDDCLKIKCDKSVEGQDFEIGMNINVCNDPINIDLFVKDKSVGKGFSKKLTASGRWDIPDISWHIPHVGTVGATVPYSIEGEKHALTIHLGLQGCLNIGSFPEELKKCFPKSGYEIISHTFDFSFIHC